MVVDALDLCYTKSHVDTFVIISGDSDFSPLVSKLRENAKTVIGIGVKKSTSDLFISNCDEFIYYDDLVRVEQVKRRPSAAPSTRSARPAPEKDRGSGPSIDGALDLLTKTLEALRAERGEDYHDSRLPGETGDQTPESRFQRARARFPRLQRASPRSPKARPPKAGGR